MRIHTGERPFRCTYPGCNMAFSQRSTYRNHVRRHGSNAPRTTVPMKSMNRPYPCTVESCIASFNTEAELNDHVILHEVKGMLTCPIPNCDTIFQSVNQLIPHLSCHDVKKLYVCPCKGCRSAYDTIDKLNDHLVVHAVKQRDNTNPQSSSIHSSSSYFDRSIVQASNRLPIADPQLVGKPADIQPPNHSAVSSSNPSNSTSSHSRHFSPGMTIKAVPASVNSVAVTHAHPTTSSTSTSSSSATAVMSGMNGSALAKVGEALTGEAVGQAVVMIDGVPYTISSTVPPDPNSNLTNGNSRYVNHGKSGSASSIPTPTPSQPLSQANSTVSSMPYPYLYMTQSPYGTPVTSVTSVTSANPANPTPYPVQQIPSAANVNYLYSPASAALVQKSPSSSLQGNGVQEPAVPIQSASSSKPFMQAGQPSSSSSTTSTTSTTTTTTTTSIPPPPSVTSSSSSSSTAYTVESSGMNKEATSHQAEIRQPPTKSKPMPEVKSTSSSSSSSSSSVEQSIDLDRISRSIQSSRIFQCTVQGCNCIFKKSRDLHAHMRLHPVNKPFKCPVQGCNEAYTTSGGLNLHLKMHGV